jgi:ankyrin repeat protein
MATAASIATKHHIEASGTKAKKIPTGSPQAFINKELKRRGYNLKSYATLESAYYTHPNAHQLASYGRIVTKAMYQPNNTKVLGTLLECGISPNACNKFGESIVHLVCRRGHYDLLTMLMDAGCSIKVSDDYGRTPLHDACWQSKPNFEVIRLILQTDKDLIRMRDIRGTTPLSYVKKENFVAWNEFLLTIMDEFWPRRNPDTDGPEEPPALTEQRPNTIQLREHNIPLTIDQIGMLATGQMTVEEAQLLAMDDDSTFDSDDSSSYYDSDDSSFYDSDSSFDEAELEEVCMLAGNFNMKEYCVR